MEEQRKSQGVNDPHFSPFPGDMYFNALSAKEMKICGKAEFTKIRISPSIISIIFGKQPKTEDEIYTKSNQYTHRKYDSQNRQRDPLV